MSATTSPPQSRKKRKSQIDPSALADKYLQTNVVTDATNAICDIYSELQSMLTYHILQPASSLAISRESHQTNRNNPTDIHIGRPLMQIRACITTRFVPRINPASIRIHDTKNSEYCHVGSSVQSGNKVPVMVKLVDVNINTNEECFVQMAKFADHMPEPWRMWIKHHSAASISSSMHICNHGYDHVGEDCTQLGQVEWKCYFSESQCLAFVKHLCSSSWFNEPIHVMSFHRNRPSRMVELVNNVTQMFRRSNNELHDSFGAITTVVDNDFVCNEGYYEQNNNIPNLDNSTFDFNVMMDTDYNNRLFDAIKSLVDHMLIPDNHVSQQSYDAFFHSLCTNTAVVESIKSFINTNSHVYSSNFEAIAHPYTDEFGTISADETEFTAVYHHVTNHVAASITHLISIDHSYIDINECPPFTIECCNIQGKDHHYAEHRRCLYKKIGVSSLYPSPTIFFEQIRPTRSPWADRMILDPESEIIVGQESTLTPIFILMDRDQINLELCAMSRTNITKRICIQNDWIHDIKTHPVVSKCNILCNFFTNLQTLRRVLVLANNLVPTRNDQSPTLEACGLIQDIITLKKMQEHGVRFKKLSIWPSLIGFKKPFNNKVSFNPTGACKHTFPSKRNLNLSSDYRFSYDGMFLVFTIGNRIESYLYTHILCAYDITFQDDNIATTLPIYMIKPDNSKTSVVDKPVRRRLTLKHRYDTQSQHLEDSRHNKIDVRKLVHTHRADLIFQTSLNNIALGCKETYVQAYVTLHTFDMIQDPPSDDGHVLTSHMNAHYSFEMVFKGSNYIRMTPVAEVLTCEFVCELSTVVRSMAFFLLTNTCDLPSYLSDIITRNHAQQLVDPNAYTSARYDVKSIVKILNTLLFKTNDIGVNGRREICDILKVNVDNILVDVGIVTKEVKKVQSSDSLYAQSQPAHQGVIANAILHMPSGHRMDSEELSIFAFGTGKNRASFRTENGPIFNIYGASTRNVVKTLRFRSTYVSMVDRNISLIDLNPDPAKKKIVWSCAVHLPSREHVHGIAKCLGFREICGKFHIAYAQNHILRLDDAVKHAFKMPAISEIDGSSPFVNISGIVCGLVDVAKGILRMANKSVVHGNIAIDTIWFDRFRHAFITDFENARMAEISDDGSAQCFAFDDQIAFAKLVIEIFHNNNASTSKRCHLSSTGHVYIPCVPGTLHFKKSKYTGNRSTEEEVRNGSVRFCVLLRSTLRISIGLTQDDHQQECWPCAQFDNAIRHLKIAWPDNHCDDKMAYTHPFTKQETNTESSNKNQLKKDDVWKLYCARWLLKYGPSTHVDNIAIVNDVVYHTRYMPIINSNEFERIRIEMIHMASMLLWDAYIWPNINVLEIDEADRPYSRCDWYQISNQPLKKTMVNNMHNAIARMEVLLSSMQYNLRVYAE